MKIELKELKLNSFESKEYKKFVDNSYNEWVNNWKNKDKKIKNSWTGKFQIDYKGKVGTFNIDTEGDYLTYLDLEGFLAGEEFPLEDGISIRPASHSSNIMVAVIFSESIRLGLIDEDEASYLSMNIVPEWSRGLIPSDVLEEEEIKEFYEKTLNYLEKKGILEICEVDTENTQVILQEEVDEEHEDFLDFVKKYIKEDLFFYIHNSNLR